MKNIIAIVQALARRTFRGSVVPDAALKAFQGRLGALADAHNLLVRENWTQSRIDDLIRASLETCGIEPGRVTLDGPPVWIEARLAVSFAIASHELCTNALKYGALSNEAGRIEVSWNVESGGDAPRLRLVWREHGGPPVTPPTTSGFGMQMIRRALAAEMNGEAKVSFKREGLVCELDAPLPQDQPDGGAKD